MLLMADHPEILLIVIALLGVAAQWLAWKLRLPAIVVLSAAGLVAGPMLGWFQPRVDFGAWFHPLIRVAVAVILFEGGLNLHFYELKLVAPAVRRLVTLGVVSSWLLGTLCGHYVAGLSWPVAFVLGAILVVTGPTVIVPLLRQARLTRRAASFLRWEGIINDPVGALLAVLVFEYVVYEGAGSALPGLFVSLTVAVVCGLALGIGGGTLLAAGFRRAQVPEYLKAPVILTAVWVVYGLANLVQQEAGLLATTVLGITLGNSRLPSIDELRRFKEAVTVILVSVIFLLLTASIDPLVLDLIHWRAAAFLVTVLIVVRPLAVFLSTIGGGMEWSERVLVGWIAPRGIVAAAVAGVFGPRLLARGYDDAVLLVPLVFAVIFSTVILHGFSIGWLTRRLGLAAQNSDGVLIVGASTWSTELARMLREMGIHVLLADAQWQHLRPARLAGVPIHYGELLSELSEETLELNELGYLLAVTDNDAYNALSCTYLAPEFGRYRVFQLPMHEADPDDPRALRLSLRGRTLIGKDETYEELMRRTYLGWSFRRTKITHNYSFADYQSENAAAVAPVMIVRGNGALIFVTPDEPFEPQPGDTVLSFCSPRVSPETHRNE